MREIKFRVWNTETNKMIINVKEMGVFALKSIYTIDEFLVIPTDEKYPLMQYTGLKDKNDVEIYEGDIVKDGSRLWKIEISPIYGIFFILSKGGHTRCYGDFASYLVDDFQVIGNIYEQSYLLDNNS